MSATVEEAKQWVIDLVEDKLPDFVKACSYEGSDALIFHQDAFAADYQFAELELLGAAIKYAGLKGKVIHITGKNGESLKKA